MADDRTFDPETEWLRHVQPEGLVVAPMVLKALGPWLIPLSQVTPFRLFPLLGRLATGTESQRHGRPTWVAKDLTHPQGASNRLREPLWPSPESTG